jgi:thiamine-phosphate pyrophosphorylase
VPALPRLIALSPGTLVDGRPAAFLGAFLGALERALAAGLPGLLLREPRLSDRAYLELARTVLALQTPRAFWFGVHDRAHLAGELGADALHLSFRSLRPAELRGWLAPGIALGLSTHAGDDARAWEGADYLFHGPLRAVPAKAEPVGLEGLARARAAAPARCAVLALGGVQPADGPALRALGLHGVAALSGLLGAADPAQATHAYLAGLRE